MDQACGRSARRPLRRRLAYRSGLIELRPPEPEDRLPWCALVGTSRRFFANRVDLAPTAAAFRAYLARSHDPAAVCRLIWRRSDGVLLGAINLTEIVRGRFQSGYLGYYVGAPHARRGYMTEALQRMLRSAFRELRLHRVEAACIPTNAPSIGLLEKTGFQREGYARRYLCINGVWQDHLLYARLSDDP